jgi:hypothetical protein
VATAAARRTPRTLRAEAPIKTLRKNLQNLAEDEWLTRLRGGGGSPHPVTVRRRWSDRKFEMRTGEFPGAVFPGELQRSGVGRVVAENGCEEKGQVGKTGFKWWRGEARNQPRSSQVFTVLPLSFGFECSASRCSRGEQCILLASYSGKQ